MSFIATFDAAGILKQIVDGVKPLVSEVNLVCDEHGMSFQAMDASHVSLCSVKIRGEALAHYSCTSTMVLGLPLLHVDKILSTIHPTDRLTLEAEGSMLHLSVVRDTRVSEFSLHLMTIEQEQIEIPPVDPSQQHCSCNMPSSVFQKTIRDLALLGDRCSLTFRPGEVCFSATGDIGSGHLTLKSTQDVEVTALAETSGDFATRYLALFAKCGNVAPSVSIAMLDKQPLRIRYCSAFASLEFFLAPRIDDL